MCVECLNKNPNDIRCFVFMSILEWYSIDANAIRYRLRRTIAEKTMYLYLQNILSKGKIDRQKLKLLMFPWWLVFVHTKLFCYQTPTFISFVKMNFPRKNSVLPLFIALFIITYILYSKVWKFGVYWASVCSQNSMTLLKGKKKSYSAKQSSIPMAMCSNSFVSMSCDSIEKQRASELRDLSLIVFSKFEFSELFPSTESKRVHKIHTEWQLVGNEINKTHKTRNKIKHNSVQTEWHFAVLRTFIPKPSSYSNSNIHVISVDQTLSLFRHVCLGFQFVFLHFLPCSYLKFKCFHFIAVSSSVLQVRAHSIEQICKRFGWELSLNRSEFWSILLDYVHN